VVPTSQEEVIVFHFGDGESGGGGTSGTW